MNSPNFKTKRGKTRLSECKDTSHELAKSATKTTRKPSNQLIHCIYSSFSSSTLFWQIWQLCVKSLGLWFLCTKTLIKFSAITLSIFCRFYGILITSHKNEHIDFLIFRYFFYVIKLSNLPCVILTIHVKQTLHVMAHYICRPQPILSDLLTLC